jgi:hypothetical protein
MLNEIERRTMAQRRTLSNANRSIRKAAVEKGFVDGGTESASEFLLRTLIAEKNVGEGMRIENPPIFVQTPVDIV